MLNTISLSGNTSVYIVIDQWMMLKLFQVLGCYEECCDYWYLDWYNHGGEEAIGRSREQLVEM